MARQAVARTTTSSNRERMQIAVAKLVEVHGAVTDPVSAAIEVHKAARAQLEANACFEDEFGHDIWRRPRVQIANLIVSDGVRQPIYAHTMAEVVADIKRTKELFSAMGQKAFAKKLWERRKRLLSDLDLDRKALKRLQDRSGYTEAATKYEIARDAEGSAYKALSKCVPTTGAGVAALALYIAAFERSMQPKGIPVAEEAIYRTLRTIAKAARCLAA